MNGVPKKLVKLSLGRVLGIAEAYVVFEAFIVCYPLTNITKCSLKKASLEVPRSIFPTCPSVHDHPSSHATKDTTEII